MTTTLTTPHSGDTGEVWFLTGSQRLYGSDVLDEVARQSRTVAAFLDDAPELSARVLWKPVLTDPSAIVEAIRLANADPRCVGVITWMHTFSPARMWIAGIDALRKPLLHLHTQLNRELPWDTIDMDFMNVNQSAHGDREFGYLLSRLGVRRTTVVGHVTDRAVARRIDAWARAASGSAHLRALQVARFGDNMRDVAVTEGDKVEAQLRYGVSVNGYGVSDLTQAVDGADESSVDETVDDYLTSYDVVDELLPGGTRHASLRYAARLEVGIRAMLADGFGAFTTNFEDLGGLRQLPGIAVQRLMHAGFGFGAEGDWKAASLLAVVKRMGVGAHGGSSFMEDYAYHFGPGTPRILGAHMLEVCPSIAAARPTCEIHPLGIGDREDPVRLVFDAAPAHGLVIGLVDLGDRFRLVANRITIVGPDSPLRRLPVARAVWAPSPSLSLSAEAWLAAGGPHHTVLTTELTTDALRDFATMTNTELVLIDESTRPGDVADRLRWNEAYYRLADGRVRRS